MIRITDAPLPGSVFVQTEMRNVVERFFSSSMKPDAPPCEFVEAEFDGLKVAVEDLGVDDRGASRRSCTVLAGGVLSEFGDVEHDRSVPDGSLFGSRDVDERTIERIRRWAIGHGLRDTGPERPSGTR